MLKLNMGCGQSKLAGYVNVDKFAAAAPDVLLDLEQKEWSWFGDGRIERWAENSVTEVVFNHSLEHMGADPAVFLRIMQNLYRICAPDAVVRINVPHPRHDHFIGDPTHVRVITPEVLSLFSMANCRRWAEAGAANSPLALYLGVDFEIVQTTRVLDGRWSNLLQAGEITALELDSAMLKYNNVVKELRIQLRVVKPGAPQ